MGKHFISAIGVFVLIFVFNAFGQQEKVVATFAGTKITLKEFEKAYARNSGGEDKAKKDSINQLEKFLDLYVVFRMKLADAQQKGYDTLSALQYELMDYKKKVGNTYLVEKELIDPALRDLYQKRKLEYRVSHIMVKLDSASNTFNKNTADSVLKAVKNGADFTKLCTKYSVDQYTKDKGGDIYYITAGMIIPEFEDAVYATKKGEVYPNVLQTRFGYHIIKVTEIKERKHEIRASHILIDFQNDKGETDSLGALRKIENIKEELKKGADFGELAKKYSKDFGSRENGGDINYFDRAKVVPEFYEAASNLKVGQVSDIVKTNYGFHLIKLTDIKPFPTYEDEKENLRKVYRQLRFPKENANFIAKLKTKVGFKINDDVVGKCALKSDTNNVNSSYWKSNFRDEVKNWKIYKLGTEEFTVDSLISYMSNLYEFMNRKIDATLLNKAIDQMANEIVVDIEAMQLDKTNTEFSELMKDYKNGIHIFKLQDEMIWGKIKPDSIRLIKYYQANMEKYSWKERVEFSEIFTRTDSLAKAYIEMLKNGENFDTLAAKYTERPGYKEKAGKYAPTEIVGSEIASNVNKLKNLNDFSATPFNNAGGFSIFKLIKKYPASLKSLDDAKAEVSGQFQEEETKRLEKEYNSDIQNRFAPKYYKEVLKDAFKAKVY